MHRTLAALVAVSLALMSSGFAEAGVAYSVVGSTYSQNFNGLPTNMPSNASIETLYTDGWQDDVDPAVSAQNDVSIPGWHLYHPISPASENGFNGNQRLRVGPGANTGAFWAFGATAANAEKALGSVGSTTVAANNANMYIGLQLVNNTGQLINEFTLSFFGEQWRDGESASPETLSFAFSQTATDADWNTTASFTPVPSLNFSSPVFSGTGSSGTAVDGNAAGRSALLTATVGGVLWQPGGELWLRWADPQITGVSSGLADDGLAIDDLSFVGSFAIPEASSFLFGGLACSVIAGRLAVARLRRGA